MNKFDEFIMNAVYMVMMGVMQGAVVVQIVRFNQCRPILQVLNPF